MTDTPPTKKIMRTYKFRLYPTPEQDIRMRSWCGAVRAVYNAALLQRKWYGRPVGTDPHERNCRFNYKRQDAELKHIRAEFEWVSDCHSDTLKAALRDLDNAFQSFFTGRAHYPKPRRKHEKESFQVPCFKVGKAWENGWLAMVVFGKDCVRLPKLGRVTWVKHTKIKGRAKTATVIREGSRWYICIASEIEVALWPAPGAAVGVDVGVAVPFMTSDGVALPFSRTPASLTKREKRLHRELNRCKRESKRRAARRAKLAEASRHIAARRKSQLHAITTSLARSYGLVAIEDLRVSNMTRSAVGTVEAPGRNVKAKAGLNRSILDVSPYLFRSLLTYKVEARGGMVVAVDPKNTSRTCFVCGHVDAENRRSQAEFRCVQCGHEDNADTNAARNILRKALESLSSATVAGRRKAPSEQRRRSATPKLSVSPSRAGQGSKSVAQESKEAALLHGLTFGPPVVVEWPGTDRNRANNGHVVDITCGKCTAWT